MEIIEILKLISDKNRMRILNILHNKNKTCVCILEEILELNQSNLSRHLNKLKKAGIIVGEKRVQWVYYEISEKFLKENYFVKEILESRLNGGIFLEDLNRIKYSEC
ncbi:MULTISPECIES: ArsR/SmtB family transcription factor [Psychrilyobacter]|uniref:ArsR family transcriptional regulator n=1 Tax=Psychrilyobacter piezotolerans TaxID=2293438 RepID=A0ABX9KFA2_9FUSO|nr:MULTISPECIES: metalloregulator ArsR/SmtB family transcription factor [Psychrilyobacter]MCS5420891.1 metalloregulator ArsR/SmtB family transcription factor [Psychrilyobacter sp. S5]NDI78548.1 winged helix-turn-helix transcriptional regulator [Psychrilyobacter piezotolerans]RDE60445.1 ArsR family transcriptional regulator [Psychrilyobacter sp. S5]REI40475.1 ArsR family transcriptional regulator [Psychrilyobacter piezotolerans]